MLTHEWMPVYSAPMQKARSARRRTERGARQLNQAQNGRTMLADPGSPDSGSPEPYWKCVVAAVPQFLLSLQFELVSRGFKPFNLTAPDLIAALSGEAIAIYAGGVIGMFCVFLSGNAFWRAIRNFQIVTAMIAITVSAYSTGGAAVAIQFLAMILITCLGLLMSWKNPAASLQVVSRCVVAYAAMTSAMLLCDAPETMKWEGDVRVLQAGSVYFFILGAVELSGLHLRYIPRNRVMIWTKLYGIVGKTYP